LWSQHRPQRGFFVKKSPKWPSFARWEAATSFS
jgi:hypothetical protein